MTSPQGICDNFQKQDLPRVPRHPVIVENGSVTRGGLFKSSGDRKASPDSTRYFKHVRVRDGSPFQVDSELHWHRVWYVVVHRACRLGLTENTCVELSAFAIIVWYIYRDRRTLKFSALIRTIVAEATVYFLVMVAAQAYGIVGVWPFPWVSPFRYD